MGSTGRPKTGPASLKANSPTYGRTARGGTPGPAGSAAEGFERRHECLVEADPADGEPGRADRYIALHLGILSRSQLKARGAAIFVDGKPAKLSRPLKAGERLKVTWTEEPPPGLEPEDIPLTVLYEDERVWVIDKAQGMVTHPGHGNRRGTLANALLGRLHAAGEGRLPCAADALAPQAPAVRGLAPRGLAPRDLALRDLALRGGIVHRLDKDTSGLIVAAKDAEAQAFLAAQFRERTARKEYLAITRGVPVPAVGRIENRLARDRKDRKRFAALPEEGPAERGSATRGRAAGDTASGRPTRNPTPAGKAALTEWRVLSTFGDYALVSLRPRTGRTHQLRVHLAGLGTPILGDPIYGTRDPRFPGATLMLHAWRLRITLPGRTEATLFRAPPPERFRALLALLEERFGKAGPASG